MAAATGKPRPPGTFGATATRADLATQGAKNVVSIVPSPTGQGYVEIDSQGRIYRFGHTPRWVRTPTYPSTTDPSPTTTTVGAGGSTSSPSSGTTTAETAAPPVPANSPTVSTPGTGTTFASATTTAAPTTTTADPTTTATTVAPTTTPTMASGSPQPVGGAPGPWHMVFDDEFNGTSLDTAKWSVGWFGSGITGPVTPAYDQAVYAPAQVSVADGALRLTAIAEQNTDSEGTYQYTSGVVTTMAPAYPWTAPALFSFTYGYMQARIRLPGSGSIADWPAFWAHGFSSDETDGEIDVLEGIGGDAVAHFANSEGAEGPVTGSGSFTGGWHIFGADWEPGSVTYYYDGTNIGSFTSGITGEPMYLVLDLAVSSTISPPISVPVTMLVDYVRVWQH